jgi:hypothetical protein
MIETALVGLHFTSNGGDHRAYGRVVARVEPLWYLVEIDGSLRLLEIFDMHGFTFARQKKS